MKGKGEERRVACVWRDGNLGGFILGVQSKGNVANGEII